MANVLSEDKRQKVEALGRLGWSLRRIQREALVRRETASAYLKAAGIEVRGRGGGKPKPATSVEVITDPADSKPATSTEVITDPADPKPATPAEVITDLAPVEPSTAIDAPGAAKVVYLDDNGMPSATQLSTGSPGIALALNVPVGESSIAVQAGSVIYRAVPVTSRANTFVYSPRLP